LSLKSKLRNICKRDFLWCLFNHAERQSQIAPGNIDARVRKKERMDWMKKIYIRLRHIWITWILKNNESNKCYSEQKFIFSICVFWFILGRLQKASICLYCMNSWSNMNRLQKWHLSLQYIIKLKWLKKLHYIKTFCQVF